MVHVWFRCLIRIDAPSSSWLPAQQAFAEYKEKYFSVAKIKKFISFSRLSNEEWQQLEI
jgi:hypothetical protein